MPDIEQWFNRYYSVLIAFAFKMVRDQESAKEIVQELFIHLVEKKDHLSVPDSPKAYLFQAVRNRCLNFLKKSQNQAHVSLDHVASRSDQISDPMEAAEFEHMLYQWIEQLPAACKQVFQMSRFEGKRNQEIADSLNISKRTVETQISKALRILRNKLNESKIPKSSRSHLMSIFL